MASIKDVAKEAGVGVGTVSRAINNTGYVSSETRKKIDKAVQKLNYTPNELARNLFRNRSGIVGVIVPDLDHPFFSCLVKNIEMQLYSQGYKTMVCNAVGISDREREYLDMLERNIVDGIITGSHCLDWEEYLKQAKPIVSIDRDFGPKIPIVGSDHAMGGRLAAELMLRDGRKNVLQIVGVSPNILANEKSIIFQSTLEQNGVSVQTISMDWNAFEWEAFHKTALKAIEEYPGIDGIFAGDLGVIACMNTLLEKGVRIPEDISLVGFDATSVTKMANPSITAIWQNIPLLAEVSVSTLLDQIEQRRDILHRQILNVEIAYGGTTKAGAGGVTG